MSSVATIAVWVISAAAVFGMLVRPWRSPEWVWALGGAIAVVATGLLPVAGALGAVARGANVYAFLLGILALAELARAARLFDWVAVRILRLSGGSGGKLLGLVYLAGVVVTALLSNDTTVVVLTPAVLAALRRSDADPLPHLYACAFVANAASFILPVSNPANLVVFGSTLPALRPWIGAFGPAAAASVALTFAVLFVVFRRGLRRPFSSDDGEVTLPSGAGAAAWLVAGATAALAVSAWIGLDVGYTALAAALIASAALGWRDRYTAIAALRNVEWTIVLLVAGLFVIVTALDRTGAIGIARNVLHHADAMGFVRGNLFAGAATTVAANLFNNLPVGLVAGFALQSTQLTPALAHATLVAVDLGPNLSVTGSLATLLWLLVLRREGIAVSPWRFLALGAVVLTPALAASLLLVR
jgi:arsenical pump membrane protein